MSSPERHWNTTRKITAALLFVWLTVTFGVIFYARELSQFTLWGWPLSFFMAAQGLTLLYVSIIAVYAFLLNRADARDDETDSF